MEDDFAGLRAPHPDMREKEYMRGFTPHPDLGSFFGKKLLRTRKNRTAWVSDYQIKIANKSAVVSLVFLFGAHNTA